MPGYNSPRKRHGRPSLTGWPFPFIGFPERMRPLILFRTSRTAEKRERVTLSIGVSAARPGRRGTVETDSLEALRFPIGRHKAPAWFDRRDVDTCIDVITELPGQARAALSGLGDPELDKRYRPGGWSVRQLAYHMADSHTHCYIRFKWTLTESEPLIKAYDEARWAELPDSRGPVGIALDGLESIHARWIALMRTMSDADFRKGFIHPETGGRMTLFDRVSAYAWHGRHHLAHIRLALGG